jgi:hypothetical protein
MGLGVVWELVEMVGVEPATRSALAPSAIRAVSVETVASPALPLWRPAVSRSDMPSSAMRRTMRSHAPEQEK